MDLKLNQDCPAKLAKEKGLYNKLSSAVYTSHVKRGSVDPFRSRKQVDSIAPSQIIFPQIPREHTVVFDELPPTSHLSAVRNFSHSRF